MRNIPYREAIREATDQLMEKDPSVYVMGLGVPDPKGIFGTTLGLQEKYGPRRVLDMPTSENGMLGVAIGSSLVGMRPIITHQRVDFFLLALDQLINNAAKWNYMFGGQASVPLVVRLVMGRGWGQGPQHSQTLHSLFAHIPGLKVVMPATAYDAKGLLVASVEDPHPVIFFEHRWLHEICGEVPEALYKIPLGKGRIVQEGSDVTLIACSQMVVEAWKAATLLKEEGISVEVVDLRTVRPLDTDLILNSVKKTGRVVIADPDWKTGGLAGEIMALIAESEWSSLKCAPRRITYPDRLCPTSWALANHYYPGSSEIVVEVLKMMEKPVGVRRVLEGLLDAKIKAPLDIPDPTFKGPF